MSGGSRTNPDLRYGNFIIREGDRWRNIRAHVYSYRLAHGPVPPGRQVRHTCDVSRCVNPDHLIIGTHGDNMRDAAERGRLHVPRPSAHIFSPEEIQDVRRMVREGPVGTAARIARERGVSKTYISMLVRGVRRQYDAPLVWSE